MSVERDRRVDDLRERLRSLGYLDAGVDRYVLASAQPSRRPAVIALFASLRIGILAAVLLGPATAIGLTTHVPGLVTGPRDAVVAALYLGLLLGTAVAAAAFGASVFASLAVTASQTASPQFARRARMLAIAAGILVTAGCLAYLTLWWRAATAAPAWGSPLWTAFALVVAALISLLLGHAVTVTALALTVARPGQMLSMRLPNTSWQASLLGLVIALLGAGGVLLSTTGAPARDEQSPALMVKSNGARVIVLAIDGFDAQMYDRLHPEPIATAAAGLFTVFGGARADLAPSDSSDPARLWTTIATGVRAERHGVDGLESRRVAGLQGRLGSGSTARVIGAASDVLRLTRPAIASNFERRVKTFWEVAEQAGFRTGVVNWWATWPASTAGGTVISDRAVLRLERGGPLDAELAPPQLYDRLKTRWPGIRAHAQKLVRTYFSQDAPFHPALPADLKTVLTRSGELDASMLQLAGVLDDGLDLAVVYLPGLDIAQHTLLAGDTGASAPSELDVRLAALQRYYGFLGSLTGASVGDGRNDSIVFVLTQPGRLHRGRGVMAAAGAGLRSATRGSATILDIAPTILHMLGIPVSRGLDGDVVTGLFREEFLASYPIRYVETYGVRGAIAATRGSTPLDQEMIDRLRSLGYLR